MKQYSREDIDLVMALSGFNEEVAMRALVLRDELAKLRMDGFNHPEAIDELSLRMKRLVGSKRRPSFPLTLSPTARLTKRHRKSKSLETTMTSDLLLAPSYLPQKNSYERLSSSASTFSPRAKRVHDRGEESAVLHKRQRLLDALEVDYDASQLHNGADDNEVTVRGVGMIISLGLRCWHH